MINNYDFPQSQGYLDLCNELRKFGFRTRRDERLTASEMLKAVTDTAEKDFSSDECFVCVIVSDGSKDGIYGTDNKVIKLNDITKLFGHAECPSLRGKPKIFLIEVCQESQTDKGPDSAPHPVISEDDFLICYASASARGLRSEKPIYFLGQKLKSVPQESGTTVDIKMMMEKSLLKEHWQLVSTLTKKVCFKRKS